MHKACILKLEKRYSPFKSGKKINEIDMAVPDNLLWHPSLWVMFVNNTCTLFYTKELLKSWSAAPL